MQLQSLGSEEQLFTFYNRKRCVYIRSGITSVTCYGVGGDAITCMDDKTFYISCSDLEAQYLFVYTSKKRQTESVEDTRRESLRVLTARLTR
jgi:uncharacterized protein (UPF0254 family)